MGGYPALLSAVIATGVALVADALVRLVNDEVVLRVELFHLSSVLNRRLRHTLVECGFGFDTRVAPDPDGVGGELGVGDSVGFGGGGFGGDPFVGGHRGGLRDRIVGIGGGFEFGGLGKPGGFGAAHQRLETA